MPPIRDVSSSGRELWDIDSAEVEAAIAVVYAPQLPIPMRWPAEERSAFIEEYAGEAACVLMSELDGIVDWVTDWVARSEFIGEERSALMEAEQQVLLDEAGSSVRNDLALT